MNLFLANRLYMVSSSSLLNIRSTVMHRYDRHKTVSKHVDTLRNTCIICEPSTRLGGSDLKQLCRIDNDHGRGPPHQSLPRAETTVQIGCTTTRLCGDSAMMRIIRDFHVPEMYCVQHRFVKSCVCFCLRLTSLCSCNKRKCLAHRHPKTDNEPV